MAKGKILEDMVGSLHLPDMKFYEGEEKNDSCDLADIYEREGEEL